MILFSGKRKHLAKSGDTSDWHSCGLMVWTGLPLESSVDAGGGKSADKHSVPATQGNDLNKELPCSQCQYC